MQAFIEMTQWDDGKSFHHVYWMDDAKNKAYAYARWGNPADTQVFKNPIQIDIRGRRFEPVQNIFGFVDQKEPAKNQWKFTGSKGNKYVVTLEEGVYNCTCNGFRFRGACKHVTELEGTKSCIN
jgi:hypothetical protein